MQHILSIRRVFNRFSAYRSPINVRLTECPQLLPKNIILRVGDSGSYPRCFPAITSNVLQHWPYGAISLSSVKRQHACCGTFQIPRSAQFQSAFGCLKAIIGTYHDSSLFRVSSGQFLVRYRMQLGLIGNTSHGREVGAVATVSESLSILYDHHDAFLFLFSANSPHFYPVVAYHNLGFTEDEKLICRPFRRAFIYANALYRRRQVGKLRTVAGILFQFSYSLFYLLDKRIKHNYRPCLPWQFVYERLIKAFTRLSN